jgi:L-asparaginase
MTTANKGVLLIYTGGTIGSMPKDATDEASPQVVVGWSEFLERTPQLAETTIGFPIGFAQTSQILDSCNIGPDQWTEIAEIIGEKYEQYEGFVILHGTDTMVYTASALSFMLVNLGKPVVLTGAQRAHLFQVRNDALQNMITALLVANPRGSKVPVIPEVMILFGQDLLRGNRTRKRDANGYSAYESPKFPRLASIGASIAVDETRIRKEPTQAFYVRKALQLNVIDFNVFPGVVQNGIADLLLDSEKFKPSGVVVRSYGSGNIPTDRGFLKRFADASNNRGVTMINVTQCTQGRVEQGLYETSNLLLAFGMVSGTDLTPEAALVKLMVALGDEDIASDRMALRNFLQTNQAGEQSTSIYEVPYPKQEGGGDISGPRPRFRFAPDRELPGAWEPADVENAQLRLYGAEVLGGGEAGTEPIELEVYANLSSNEDPGGPSSPKFAGTARRAPTTEKTILSFEVSAATRRLFRPGARASFSLVLKSSGSLSWERAELALFIKG